MAISSRIDQKPASPNLTGDRTQLSLPIDVCKINLNNQMLARIFKKIATLIFIVNTFRL